MLEDFQRRQRWVNLLEQEVPQRLDQITPEGYEPLLRHYLLPGSLEIVTVQERNDPAQGIAPHVVVAYLLGSNEVWQDRERVGFRNGVFPVETEIPLNGDDTLNLAEVDWLGPDDEQEPAESPV